MLYLLFTESMKRGRVDIYNNFSLMSRQEIVLCWSDLTTISRVQKNLKSDSKDKRHSKHRQRREENHAHGGHYLDSIIKR